MLKKLSFYLVKKYRHSTIPQVYILIMDIFLFVVAFFLMEAFRVDLIKDLHVRGLIVKFVISLMLTILFYFFTGSYKGIIRHAGMSDIYKILLATVGSVIVCWVVNIVNYQFRPPIIHSSYLLSYRESLMLYAILAVLLTASRLFMQRVYNNYFRRRRRTINVVIYGAGSAGIIAYNALNQESAYEYKVVAFIDDDMSKVNSELNGVPVLRARTALNANFIGQKKISQLIIAIPSIRLKHKQAITNKALDLGLIVKAVPHASMWLNGAFSANQIQEIKIEDLLERESIKIDNVNVVREVADKVILVTGAALST